MFDILLLVLYTAFFIYSFQYIFKRNILFGGLYFFLFIYNIFAQIGYCFVPELSEIIKAYFGREYFYQFYIFNFLSFLAFFFIFKYTFPYVERIRNYEIVKDRNSTNYLIFIIVILGMWLFLFLFSVTKGNAIDYNTAYDEDYVNSQGFLYKLFRIGFKLMVPISVILYAQARFKSRFRQITYSNSILVVVIALMFIGLFLFLANKLGSRSDIVALTLGILILEYKLGLTFKRILTIGAFGFILILFLLYIEQTRTTSSTDDLSFVQKFLLKDYYAPAHILYASMAYDYIKPLEVLQSNISNTLIKLDYPYLQAPVTDLFNPGVATRSAGYAFYLFTEGYIFMGNFGFIYNGLMLMIGLSVWYLIQKSSNKYYNYIILGIMCTQLANLARNQSSYIYKDIYIFFIPILIILYLSSGLRPKLTFK